MQIANLGKYELQIANVGHVNIAVVPMRPPAVKA